MIISKGENNMKKFIAVLLTLMMTLALTACGDKGPDVTGKYICVGESYFDGELQEPYEESWLELKKGGKGIYFTGYEFDRSGSSMARASTVR